MTHEEIQNEEAAEKNSE